MRVGREDTQLVLQNIVGLQSFDEGQVTVADVDGNGVVTAWDAKLITQCIVKLTSGFPVEGEPAYMEEKNPEAFLLVKGNTVYIDTEGEWNTFEGQITFDSEKAHITDCIVSEELQTTASEHWIEGSFEQGGI